MLNIATSISTTSISASLLNKELFTVSYISWYERNCIVCAKIIQVDKESADLNLVCSDSCMNVIEVNPLPYDKYLGNITVYRNVTYTANGFTKEMLKAAALNRIAVKTAKEIPLECLILKSS